MWLRPSAHSSDLASSLGQILSTQHLTGSVHSGSGESSSFNRRMESLAEFRDVFPMLSHKLIHRPIGIGRIAVPRQQTLLHDVGWSVALQPDGSHAAVERHL